jgi:hypothetical protein
MIYMRIDQIMLDSMIGAKAVGLGVEDWVNFIVFYCSKTDV